jgi:mannitol/fructose-specific phosphotransferase system IIA component (Ntr-type)
VFLIAAPAAGDGQHLKILAALARKLVNAEFKDSLRAAEDGATVAHIVNEAVAP